MRARVRAGGRAQGERALGRPHVPGVPRGGKEGGKMEHVRIAAARCAPAAADSVKVFVRDMCGRGERICVNCGDVVDETDRYCHGCGCRLWEPGQAEVEAPAAWWAYRAWLESE